MDVVELFWRISAKLNGFRYKLGNGRRQEWPNWTSDGNGENSSNTTGEIMKSFDDLCKIDGWEGDEGAKILRRSLITKSAINTADMALSRELKESVTQENKQTA